MTSETKFGTDMVAYTLRRAKGNVLQSTKDATANFWVEHRQGEGFGRFLVSRLAVTEMSIFSNPETPRKKDGLIVFEIDVAQGMQSIYIICVAGGYEANELGTPLDMCHYLQAMHGGCTSYLIDVSVRDHYHYTIS